MSAETPLLKRAQELLPQLQTWRRDFHRHPELGFAEHRTASRVAHVLGSLGIPFQGGVGKTGIVATIQGSAGPTVGLRADMDALPLQEENGTDYDSEHPGVMHACGHDAHTAMLLGAATLLSGLAAEGALPGTARLIFQPCEEAWDEEGKSGAQRMIEAGAADGLDAIFGLHVEHSARTGVVLLKSGALYAAVDEFALTLQGPGGHAAEPHHTSDVIAAAGLVIQAVHQIVSRRLDPVEPGVITISTIHGGSASNVIDTSVEMTGTVRSLSAEARARLQQELERAVRVAASLGISHSLTLTAGCPVTVNDVEATAVARWALEGLLGREHVEEAPASLGAEDFSYWAEVVPACFVLLGVQHPTWERIFAPHCPSFRLDEDALPIGAASLTAVALAWLSREAKPTTSFPW